MAGSGGCKQLALHQYRKLMVADVGKLCGNIVQKRQGFIQDFLLGGENFLEQLM